MSEKKRYSTKQAAVIILGIMLLLIGASKAMDYSEQHDPNKTFVYENLLTESSSITDALGKNYLELSAYRDSCERYVEDFTFNYAQKNWTAEEISRTTGEERIAYREGKKSEVQEMVKPFKKKLKDISLHSSEVYFLLKKLRKEYNSFKSYLSLYSSHPDLFNSEQKKEFLKDLLKMKKLNRQVIKHFNYAIALTDYKKAEKIPAKLIVTKDIPKSLTLDEELAKIGLSKGKKFTVEPITQVPSEVLEFEESLTELEQDLKKL